MAKKKFTIDNIDKFLEEIGYEWVDKLIYDPYVEDYKLAKLSSFDKDVQLYLKSLLTGQKKTMFASISNEKFELRVNSNKMDASNGWQDFLAEQKSKKASI